MSRLDVTLDHGKRPVPAEVEADTAAISARGLARALSDESAASSLMSTPAQKPRPAPESTMTPTSGRALTSLTIAGRQEEHHLPKSRVGTI